MRQLGRTVVTVRPNAISLRSGHSRFGITTRSATHAAACVFTQFRASRPALNLNTGSIVPSGHSASTSQCSPSLSTTQNIGVRAVTFHPHTHDGPARISSALFGLITQDTSKLEDAPSAGGQKRLGRDRASRGRRGPQRCCRSLLSLIVRSWLIDVKGLSGKILEQNCSGL